MIKIMSVVRLDWVFALDAFNFCMSHVHTFFKHTFFSSSFSSSSNPPVPFHIRFHDEKAKTDLFENFQNRGVHLECQVILSDFSDTAVPEVIWTRGWESLYGKPDKCPVVFI